MPLFATLWTRCRHFLRGLFRRDQVEQELREELDDHMNMLAEQKIAEGMSPHAARRAARLQLGGTDQVTEQVRDVRLSAWVGSVARESRRCFRSLVRNPLFTGTAVLTVALGIGASVTVFTIVNAVLLRPLPFPDADRLVVLKYAAPGFGGRRGGISERISGPLYFLYADESRALDGVTAIQMGNASFTDAENRQRVLTSDVTASFFDMLRTPPRIGRAFSQRDEREDAEPVVLLSDALWRTRFGADPNVVGRLVDVDGSRTEVVGVLPPSFTFLWPNIDLWRPLRLDRETVQLGNFFHMGWPESRTASRWSRPRRSSAP